MPLTEFLTSGDLKFVIAITAVAVFAIVYCFKKRKAAEAGAGAGAGDVAAAIGRRIKSLHHWILILSTLSLLLGLMHSFYFIGKAGGVATNLLFQGVSFVLVTPVYGIVLYMISRLISHVVEAKTVVES